MSLLDNLAAYYKLDEASGNALDSVGSNDLTDNNTVGSTTGKVGNARSFVAANSEYFSRADNADLSTGDIDFTVACWVNLSDKSVDRPFVAKYGFGTDKEFALIYDATTDRFSFIVQGGSTSGGRLAFAFGAPSTGTWYHVVCWHDSVNDEVGIDVNASSPQTASHSAGVNDSGEPFAVGRMVGGAGTYMDGLIDEVGFWKRVLTSDERAELYNSGDGLSYDDFGGGGSTIPLFTHHYRQQRRR